MLGIRTRGRRMVGADETTELWLGEALVALFLILIILVVRNFGSTPIMTKNKQSFYGSTQLEQMSSTNFSVALHNFTILKHSDWSNKSRDLQLQIKVFYFRKE